MIIAQIASIPDREASLWKTILNLYEQVDLLQVALNGYDHIPSFLNLWRAKVIRLDNSTGDAAKFFDVENKDGYIFTCDDDLVYPKGYVNYMINAIELYNCPVTLHGRNFRIRPIQSYYKSATEKYRCLGYVQKDVQVDVGGTGVMAWRSDMMKIKYSDFELPNMADIWFSKVCHEQDVKIMCLAHEEGYLGYTVPKFDIYSRYSKRDRTQTEIINSFLK